jgi:hypothetical protein
MYYFVYQGIVISLVHSLAFNLCYAIITLEPDACCFVGLFIEAIPPPHTHTQTRRAQVVDATRNTGGQCLVTDEAMSKCSASFMATQRLCACV